MRPRAISMYVDRSKLPQYEEGNEIENEDSDFSSQEEEEEEEDEKAAALNESSAVVKSEWLGEDTEKKEIFIFNWSLSETLELLKKISDDLDDNDRASYLTRINKLDWSKKNVNGHTPEEAKKHFQKILREMSLNHNLKEICNNMEHYVSNSFVNKPARRGYISGYNLFIKENKDKVIESKKKNKDFSNNLLSLLAKEYKELSKEEKNDYAEKARKIREDRGIMSEKITNPRSTAKKSHTVTPFNLYLESELKNKREKRDIIKKRWDVLPIREKIKWIRMALSPDVCVAKPTTILKSEHEILENYEGRPEKVPVNSYFLFRNENIGKFEHLDSYLEKMAEIKKLWSDATTKAEYNKKFEIMKAEYNAKYNTFINNLTDDRRAVVLQRDDKSSKKRILSDTDIDSESPKKKKNDTKIKSENLNTSTDFKQKKKVKKVKQEKENQNVDNNPNTIEVNSKSLKKSKKAKISITNSSDQKIEESPKKSPKKLSKKSKGEIIAEPESSPESIFAFEESPKKSPKKLHKKSKGEIIAEPERSRGSIIAFEESPKKLAKKSKGEIIAEPERSNGSIIAFEESPKKSSKKLSKKSKGEIIAEPERPPGSTFGYYVRYIYSGKINNAKKSWEKIPKSKKKSIKKQYDDNTAEYLVKLQLYLQSLPKEEMTSYVKGLQINKATHEDSDSENFSSTDEDETDTE